MKRVVNILRGVTAAGLCLLVLGAPTAAAAALPTMQDYLPIVMQRNYTFEMFTDVPYWSVIAVRPEETTNRPTLSVSDDSGVLQTSGVHDGTPEWVAIDSNAGRRPYGMYRAAVSNVSGQYRAELAQGRDTVSPTAHTALTIPAGFVVLVRDVYLTPGQSFGVTVPRDQAAIHLVTNLPALPVTWVTTGDRYVDWVEFGETPTCRVFTVEKAGWYGLVILSRSRQSVTARVYPSALTVDEIADSTTWRCPAS